MATMVVLIVGILAVSLTVLAASRQNRRNLIQAQASVIAERELERIIAMGCTGVPPTPCSNVQGLDGFTRRMAWAVSGQPQEVVVPGPVPPGLLFDVAVDVDPNLAGLYEGVAMGSPALNRFVDGQQLQQVINVRVLVSWQDNLMSGLAPDTRRAVVLQTRMVP
ncbi:type IV pilus modification PilV family protein [Pyxidicoccus trucidator]|uniref:type IV pilus modification PilV family protein n=1 Tax=Pyxidicoccus trucidator TaxID=2709662 RepID=UPI001F07B6BA|nr:hypothetical protein [Pyxidicoccus trucidator]